MVWSSRRSSTDWFDRLAAGVMRSNTWAVETCLTTIAHEEVIFVLERCHIRVFEFCPVRILHFSVLESI